MEAVKIGVIVPSRNRTQWLATCLDSIKAQTVPAHRILLVDDGSDPPLENLAKEHGVEYVRTDVGNGLNCSKVRTVGFQHLKDCDFILPIDNDDFIEPQYIEKLLNGFDSPMVAIVYPRVVSFGDCKGIRDGTISVGGMVRADVLKQLGGFPDTTGWDEMALAQMIRALGYHCRFTEAVYWYRRHNNSISGPYRSIRRPWHETVDKRADWFSVAMASYQCGKNQSVCRHPAVQSINTGSRLAFAFPSRQARINRLFTEATSDYLLILTDDEELPENAIDDMLELLQPDIDVVGLGEYGRAYDFVTVDPPTTNPAPWSQDDVGGFRLHGCILSRHVYTKYRLTTGPDWQERFFSQIYSDGLVIKARWKPCPETASEIPEGHDRKRIMPHEWAVLKAIV